MRVVEQIAALGHRITLVDAPAELLIRTWPHNTRLLASESRWNRIYRLDRTRRDIPEFQPGIGLLEGVPSLVAHLDAQGLIEDSRSDETEDRIIASLDRLSVTLAERP